jgi:hypothetical protein
MTEPISLLHEGDAYTITVKETSPRAVLVTRIIQYPRNENVNPVLISFSDLPPDTKKAVIKQINRRFVGRMVQV